MFMLTVSGLKQLLQPSCNVTRELPPTRAFLSAALVSLLPMDHPILSPVKPVIMVRSTFTPTLPLAT